MDVDHTVTYFPIGGSERKSTDVAIGPVFCNTHLAGTLITLVSINNPTQHRTFPKYYTSIHFIRKYAAGIHDWFISFMKPDLGSFESIE